MTKNPQVLSIGLETPMPTWPSIQFTDDLSCNDFEIVFWDPNRVLLGGQWGALSGTTTVNWQESPRIQQVLERRAEDFETHVSLGGTVVVFGAPGQAFELHFLDSTSATVVPANWLPGVIATKNASGKRIKVHDRGPIGEFLRSQVEKVNYKVTYELDATQWQTLAVTERAAESVSGVWLHPSGGRWILLPWMDHEFYREDDFDGSSMHGDLDEEKAAAFWLPLISALSSSSSGGEPAPEWLESTPVQQNSPLADAETPWNTSCQDVQLGLAAAEAEEARAGRANSLLYSAAEELEKSVSLVFQALGGELVGGGENRVDLVVKFPDWTAVVEVKGLGGSAGEKHSAQLEKWMTDFAGNPNVKPILVVNAYRKEDPSSRRDAFPAPDG